MKQQQIRNFTIIGHIDHGKSTLADRLLEATGTVEPRQMREQYLDKLDLERKRGITIKLQAVRMQYHPNNYIFNLIDTPGHADFAYEVSRSLAACEGAVLIVDATQGIQAQTAANFFKARNAGLVIIPVINKIDLPNARPQEVSFQLTQVLGFSPEEILFASAKTSQGVEQLLLEIAKRVPPPSGTPDKPLRALIFDSFYDQHKGVVALVKVVDGMISAKRKVQSAKFGGQSSKLFLLNQRVGFEPVEIGHMTARFIPSHQLNAGEVGYLTTGIKEIKKVRVGDTIGETEGLVPLTGYQEPQPLVFANFFPAEGENVDNLSSALDKLSLNDAALICQPISSRVLGPGFKCSFLGLFHLTIIQERLSQELGAEVIVTSPSVNYNLDHKKELWVQLEIFTPARYLGSLMQLCQERRGEFKNMEYLNIDSKHQASSSPLHDTVRLIYALPLAELITDFADQIKSLSSGYASYEYWLSGYQEADLVKVSVLVNQKPLDELSFITVGEKAASRGRSLIEVLKEVIPRQQFKVPLQAVVGGKVIARADIPALRKDVTAKLYGGDRTRKDKLLKKQVAGKKRLRKFGQVKIPQEAFLAVLTNTS